MFSIYGVLIVAIISVAVVVLVWLMGAKSFRAEVYSGDIKGFVSIDSKDDSDRLSPSE